MRRFRFCVPGDDGCRLEFPPEGPFWITGYSDSHTIVVAFSPNLETLTSKGRWPDAEDIDDGGEQEIVFTDRFQRPEWWEATSEGPHLDKWRKAEGRRNRPPKPPVPAQEEVLGNVYSRRQHRVARPGSQRRCYYGCFPSSDWEIVWGEWELTVSDTPERTLQGWPDFQRDDLKVQYKWEAA